jgi:hypothetical protein
MTYSGGISSAGRRMIAPPRQRRPTELPDGGLTRAMREAGRLEKLARACRAGLIQRDPNGVRRIIGHALDALEAIEAGLALEFPPGDPGQLVDAPSNRGLATSAPVPDADRSKR